MCVIHVCMVNKVFSNSFGIARPFARKTSSMWTRDQRHAINLDTCIQLVGGFFYCITLNILLVRTHAYTKA
jgi:hypothetical protein